MSGPSYGGGIQWVTAGIDRRVDAITPTISWNSLVRALYREGALKLGWGALLGAVSTTSIPLGALSPYGVQTGSLDPPLIEILAGGGATGSFTPAQVAYFEERDIDRVIGGVRVPTLIVQGTADTIFSPIEAMDNFAAMKGRGVPLKMIWFCGGHGLCTRRERTRRLPGDGAPGLDGPLAEGRPRRGHRAGLRVAHRHRRQVAFRRVVPAAAERPAARHGLGQPHPLARLLPHGWRPADRRQPRRECLRTRPPRRGGHARRDRRAAAPAHLHRHGGPRPDPPLRTARRHRRESRGGQPGRARPGDPRRPRSTNWSCRSSRSPSGWRRADG